MEDKINTETKIGKTAPRRATPRTGRALAERLGSPDAYGSPAERAELNRNTNWRD